MQTVSSSITQILQDQAILTKIRNQDPVIKSIFCDYATINQIVQLINGKIRFPEKMVQSNQTIFYLHPEDRDPNILLHYMAAEILSIECHHITNLIFNSQNPIQQQSDYLIQNQQNRVTPKPNHPRLITELLLFLELEDSKVDNHMLLVYFTKVMSALTKRATVSITSPVTQVIKKSNAYQFNKILAFKVFKQGYLLKTVNVLYSQIINEIILRWLGFKVHPDHLLDSSENWQVKMKNQFLEILTIIINTHVDQKGKLEISQTMNSIKNLGQWTIESAGQLILLMLRSPLGTKTKPNNPAPTTKNTNLILNKFTQLQLYSLACTSGLLQNTIQPVPKPSIKKIEYIIKIIELFKIEWENYQQLNSKKREEITWLGDYISLQILQQIFCWSFQLLKQQLNPDNDHCRKQFILVLLKLIQIVQSMSIIQENILLNYYEMHHDDLVHFINNILQLDSNILQNKISNIVLNQILVGYGDISYYKKNESQVGLVNFDLTKYFFPQKLLTSCIVELIDVKGIREHIILWAKIIMSNKINADRIYENLQEETNYQHLINLIEQVTLGTDEKMISQYRFIDGGASLPTFYSINKAKNVYAAFLSQLPTIQWNKSKQKPVIHPPLKIQLKKSMSSPPSIESSMPQQLSSKKEKQMVNQQNEDQLNNWTRAGYLKFEVECIMRELE